MLVRLLKLIRESGQRPFWLLVSPALSILGSVCEIAALFLLAPMIQVLMGGEMSLKPSFSFLGIDVPVGAFIAEGESRRTIFSFLILAFALMSMGRPILEFVANLALGKFIRGFIAGVRRRIFRNYLSYGKKYFDERGVGALSSTILQLTNEVAISLGATKTQLSSLFLGVGYVFIMMQISWKLALLSFLFVPAIGLLQREIGRRLGNAAQLSVQQLSSLTQKVTDVLRCMVFVKSANQDQAEAKRFDEISTTWGFIEYGIGKKHNLHSLINELSTIGVGLFLIGVSSLLFQRRGADFGPQFIVFFLAFKRFFQSLAGYSSFRMTLQGMKGSLGRVEQAVTYRPEYVIPSGTIPFSRSFSKIEIRDLVLRYDERLAISGLNMTICSGQMTGVIGASGSGKSSLLTLLNRLYEYQGGEILVDGIDLRKFSVASLRQSIGYVSQETYIFNDTLRFNLSYGIDRELTDKVLVDSLNKATLGPLFSKLIRGLDTVLGENGVLLSGGERQRLAIARNLLKDPAILFLDEATSALDQATELEVQSALEDLSRGRTTVVVAHRLSTIARAPVVYTMSAGRVIACQTGAEVVGELPIAKPLRAS